MLFGQNKKGRKVELKDKMQVQYKYFKSVLKESTWVNLHCTTGE